MNKHKDSTCAMFWCIHPPTRTPLHRIPIAHSTPPQMTHENAQHMNYDRCVSICWVPLEQRLQGELLQQTARCCLPNNMRPSWSANKTARIAQPSPRNAKTAKSTCATDTDAYAKQKACVKGGAAARVGRASGSAAAGGRPAPHCVSVHSCHKGSLTSSTSELAANQSASALRSSWTSWCQTLDATTSSLACTQTS